MHFAVAVFTKSGDFEEIVELMEPFSEEVTPEDEYAVQDDDGEWFNPNAKWDYYSADAGRWTNVIPTIRKTRTNHCAVRDIDLSGDPEIVPFAFVTADGDWFEKGQMGWFDISDATIESSKEFERKFFEYLDEARKKNLWIHMIDCHI